LQRLLILYRLFKLIDSKKTVVLSRGCNAFIQFCIVLFYSSKLTPSQFGELSILMIIIGLSYSIIDLGTANTIITRRINKFRCKSLQSLNLIIALILGFLFYLFNVFEVRLFNFGVEFYSVLALYLPLMGIYSLTIVPYARLHKSSKLTQLAYVDFFPVLSMLFSVPILLYLDFGLFTLLISICIQVCLRFLMIRYFYGQVLRMGRIRSLPIKSLSRQYLSNLVVYLTGKLDQVMVATFLSSETLGVYSFLKQILNYPISLLIAIYTQITFPYFSRYKFMMLKVKILLLKSLFILFASALCYFVTLILVPTEFALTYVEMWDFKSELAILVIVLSLVRVLFEALSAMSIAIGKIQSQLYINCLYMVILVVSGTYLPYIGLSNYLIILSLFSIIISIFIYNKAFSKLKYGKDSDIHSV
jgi:O-antigen/teichoic acid export membrane protein